MIEIVISVPMDVNLAYRIDDPIAARNVLKRIESIAERIGAPCDEATGYDPEDPEDCLDSRTSG